MFRSIRWTLQLWHAGILLAALVSFGTAMYFRAKDLEFKRLDAELEGAARAVEHPARPPARRGTPGRNAAAAPTSGADAGVITIRAGAIRAEGIAAVIAFAASTFSDRSRAIRWVI